MPDSLYHARVLELAADIPHLGALAQAQASVEKTSKICGSTVRVDLALDQGRVAAIGLDVRACALGQAAASVLARHAIGATTAEIRTAGAGLRAMLTAGAPAPEGRFWELRHLAGVQDYPARHASTLLAFEAAIEAIDDIERGARPA